jgi:hypothetical protein
MADCEMMNYDILGSEELGHNFELDVSQFNYQNLDGIDFTYLECETWDDYYNYYQNKHPDYGKDLWKGLADYDFKKLSRQEIRLHNKNLKKRLQKHKQELLEKERERRIQNKLNVNFD